MVLQVPSIKAVVSTSASTLRCGAEIGCMAVHLVARVLWAAIVAGLPVFSPINRFLQKKSLVKGTPNEAVVTVARSQPPQRR
jgi:hypothetical protein